MGLSIIDENLISQDDNVMDQDQVEIKLPLW